MSHRTHWIAHVENMPEGPPLSDFRYATLVVRVVLDRWGHLVQGEVLEVGGARRERFVGWNELIDVLHDWLASQDHTPRDPA
jgi:hypothetical protein